MAEHFIISRTDAIGDVILTFPVTLSLKQKFPDAKITFIGKTYTKEIISSCDLIDEFLNYDEWLSQHESERINILRELNTDAIIHVFPRKELAVAARKAGIKIRIGTSHRVFHWLNCNKLINLGRKNSDLHESELNLRLLESFKIKNKSLDQLKAEGVYLKSKHEIPDQLKTLFINAKKKIILHPKSKGSAREWGLNNFSELIKLLPKDQNAVYITGTKEEGESMKDFLKENKDSIIDLTGKLNLAELIAVINTCDGLIAASTGPLHISAALGKYALGIFPPIRPMHPGRWAPLSPRASYLCAPAPCNDCRNDPSSCACMGKVSPQNVAAVISSWE